MRLSIAAGREGVICPPRSAYVTSVPVMPIDVMKMVAMPPVNVWPVTVAIRIGVIRVVIGIRVDWIRWPAYLNSKPDLGVGVRGSEEREHSS